MEYISGLPKKVGVKERRMCSVDATMVKIKMEVGRRLIDEGLLIPHKEVDAAPVSA